MIVMNALGVTRTLQSHNAALVLAFSTFFSGGSRDQLSPIKDPILKVAISKGHIFFATHFFSKLLLGI